MTKKTEHWAYGELRRRLEEKTEVIIPDSHLRDAREPQVRRITKIPDHELGTVFLMDPAVREELDEELLERLYPHVLETLEGEALVVPTLEEVRRGITDCHQQEASRAVVFFMSDPERPVRSGQSPLWHFVFTLKVRLLSYVFSSECSLSVPFSACGSWLLDALADSRVQGAAPNLSVDTDEFVLGFSCGRGESFLGDAWKEAIAKPIRGHLKIAQTVDRFADQPHNRIIRSEMVEAIISMYGDHCLSL